MLTNHRANAFKFGASALGLIAATLFAPAAAIAQDSTASASEPEIVVTAQRREERSVDVPISVATLSNDQLQTANVTQLSDTSKLTPGLRFDSAGSAVQPTIRGVGTAITTSGGGPNVATYVDGFFLPNTYSSDIQLMKVSSIQVLKGPQGTLFGRNTTGGAILVTSADPSTETAGEVRAQYGRFNAVTLQGYVTTGLSDSVAVDVEGVFRSGDGYFTDRVAKNDKVGKYTNWSVRAGIKADFSDAVSLLVRYTHTENDDPTNQNVNVFVDSDGQAGFLSKVSAAGRTAYGRQDSRGLPLAYFFAPASTVATAPGDIRLDARTGLKVKIDMVTGTRGYKAGILNVGGLSQEVIKPETISAFEAGYKYDDRVFSFDAAGFYYDYKNLQVSSFQSGAAQIRNAASSEIYGAETQMRYRVSNAFSVNAGAAWTHARYKSFANAPYYTYCDPVAAVGTALWCVPQNLGGFGPGAIVQTTTDASGGKMQRSPEFTGNVGASYATDISGGKMTLSGNLYYTSDFFFDPSQQFRQKAYALLSLRAQWQDKSERFTIAAFGDNVTNKRFRTQVLFTTLGTGSVWNSPATYGIQFGAKF